jgi:hypothetical protein
MRRTATRPSPRRELCFTLEDRGEERGAEEERLLGNDASLPPAVTTGLGVLSPDWMIAARWGDQSRVAPASGPMRARFAWNRTP